jgi:putative transposase
MSDSQGPQRDRASAQTAARIGTKGAPAGLGVRRRGEGRAAIAQSRPQLEQQAPGVAASILEGLDEMLTVTRLGLPAKLRRSLACTNSIENMMGTVRRVCRNVKRWRNAAMALRWTAAGMLEAAKGFRRLKAHKHLPALRAALTAHQAKYTTRNKLEERLQAA